MYTLSLYTTQNMTEVPEPKDLMADPVRCKSQFPTVEDYIKDIDPITLLFTILALVATLFTCVIFFFHSKSIGQNVLSEYRRSLLRTLAALFPVVSVCCSIAICVPSTLILIKVFIPAYFARALIAFTALIRDLFGGRAGMSITLEESGIHMHLASRPCCCCCSCLPDAKPTWRNIRTLENLVVQAAVIRGILAFIVFVMFANSNEIETASLSSNGIILISTTFGMYGAYIYTDVAQKVRPMFNIRRLMGFLQLGYLLFNLQGAIFNTLASTGVIKGTVVLRPDELAAIWNFLALIFELFLLTLIASKLLAPGVCGIYDESSAIRRIQLSDISSTENGIIESHSEGNYGTWNNKFGNYNSDSN